VRSAPVDCDEWSEWDQEDEPVVEDEPVPRSPLLAIALKAASWWLARRGSWKGAIGLGLLIAGAGALGGPVVSIVEAGVV
jgi:hypothetical protein